MGSVGTGRHRANGRVGHRNDGRVRSACLRRLPLALFAAAWLACAAPAPAADADDKHVKELDAVKVSAKGVSAKDAAQADVDAVPGGAALIDQQRVEQGRTATNEDVLAYQPGVYAQAAGGGDGIKISIRGSAINRGTNYFRSGVLMLFDGLPVSGPGGTPYELFEPLGLSHTEVLRGANGFDLGALALGGAINYVSRTGQEASPFELRVEGGSYGYRKEQVSTGRVLGPWDYYVSLTESHRDGYQEHTRGESRGVAANLGHRFGDALETRFYLRWRETDNQTAGNLTRAQLQADPRQANATNLAQDTSRIQPGSAWLANKTTIRFGDASQLELGAVYHDYPIDIRSGVNRATWGFRDLSLTAQYRRNGQLFGRHGVTRIGLSSTRHLDAWQNTYVRIPSGATADIPVGTLIRRATYGGSDNVLHAGNELELTPALRLISGISAIYTTRRTEVVLPYVGQPYSRDRLAFAPRLGLTWAVTPDVQVYGNLSRSVEPPNSWAILTAPPSFSSGPATGLAVRGLDLKNQTATTIELGTRGRSRLGEWSLSLYRSAVRNELLSVEVQAATATSDAVTAESNASPTTHQGAEASLSSVLWQAGEQRLSLRQAYTYSDFRYDHDSRFGSNRLPGIPRHFYQGELRYERDAGFYAGFNTQAGSAMPVDYANSFYSKGYAIFGATFGLDAPSKRWSAWLDLRNLADKHYTAIVTPGYDDQGTDQARSVPGEGFGIYAGFTWRL